MITPSLLNTFVNVDLSKFKSSLLYFAVIYYDVGVCQ